jgi:predicted amidophosphoribosyltransferase
MEFVCPRTWEGLQPTADPDIRHCAQCNQDVHLCRTDVEAFRHARAAHCIAREEREYRVMGRPALPSELTEEMVAVLEQANPWMSRDMRIALARDLANAQGTRNCPECGHPVPGALATCLVCSFKFDPK